MHRTLVLVAVAALFAASVAGKVTDMSSHLHGWASGAANVDVDSSVASLSSIIADDGSRREPNDPNDGQCPYVDSLRDAYHPAENPDGVIGLAYAENLLLWDVLQRRLSHSPATALAHVKYEYAYGSAALRRGFAAFLRRTLGPGDPVAVHPNQLVMTSGAVSALGLALRPIFESEERRCNCTGTPAVIVPAPYYFSYDKLVVGSLGGAIVPAPFTMGTGIEHAPGSDGEKSEIVSWDRFADPDTSMPSHTGVELFVAALERAYARTQVVGSDLRPSVLLLTHPHSPLGRVYSDAQLLAAATFAAARGLHVVVDEIFAPHVFGGGAVSGPFRSMASVLASAAATGTPSPLPASHLHIVSGLGKLGLAGLKIGALWSRSETEVLPRARELSRFSQISTTTQVVVASMLADDGFVTSLLATNRARLAAAHGVAVAALKAEGIPIVRADAGMTVLLDLSAALPSLLATATGAREARLQRPVVVDEWAAEEQLRTDIQRHARVFLATGGAFHTPRAGLLRLTFADDAGRLEVAARRLGAYLARHHPEVLAQDIQRRLKVAWARSDALFRMLMPECSGCSGLRGDDGAVPAACDGEPNDATLLQRPIQLRHPFIFYLGHLPAFAWNQMKALLPPDVAPAFQPRFDDLFARGIDPDVETGECHNHSAAIHGDDSMWPHAAEIRAYRRQVRGRITDLVLPVLRAAAADGDTKAGADAVREAGLKGADALFMATGGRVFEMVLEHEMMHQETLLYMMQQYPRLRKRTPPGTPTGADHAVLDVRAAAAAAARPRHDEVVVVEGGEVRLGASLDDVRWGWDNEMPRVSASTGRFRINKFPVTNRQYAAFMAAGGYDSEEWWAPDDWSWVQRVQATHPLFWDVNATTRAGAPTTTLFRMFTDAPMSMDPSEDSAAGAAADTPVSVSQAEAAAYCRWRGGRLPSEAEWLRAAEGGGGGVGGGGVPGVHGNYGFVHWGTSPVGLSPAGDSVWGVADMFGQGWEWTRTAFHGHAGFSANLPTYPGYSADFFDGKHFVLLGGSWASDAAFLRRSFRNFYQGHYPYVFSAFRCVYDAPPAPTKLVDRAATLPASIGSVNDHDDVLEMVVLGAVETPAPLELISREVLVGLSSSPKHIPCMFMYDDTGSDIYADITELDEYYPTRTEASILERHKEALAVAATAPTPELCDSALAALDAGRSASDVFSAHEGVPFNLAELGAGDGRKSAILLRHFVNTDRAFAYTSIDISAGALRSQAARLRASSAGIDLSPTSPLRRVTLMAADNVQGIRKLTSDAKARVRGQPEMSPERLLVMFLGSSIGNFDDAQIAHFLADVWMAMSAGDLLMVGFDLRKPPATIAHAYNDTSGVTAAFNVNMLRRINTELDANFDLDAFQFHSWYDSVTGDVRSTLVSTRDQTVFVAALGREFHFDAWEAVDTEISRKFTLRQIEAYAARIGFEVVRHLMDEDGWFVDSLWRVVKTSA